MNKTDETKSEAQPRDAVALHALVSWWPRRSIARLQENIADLEAQCDTWVTAADATCKKEGGYINGVTLERIAILRGKIARFKTRLQNRKPANDQAKVRR